MRIPGFLVVSLVAVVAHAQAPAAAPVAVAPAPAAAAPATPPPGAVKAPPKAGEIVDILTAAKVKDLCFTTRPAERVPFDGDEVSKGQARDAYVSARELAMKRLYRARIPMRGIRLGEYQSKDGQLPLDFTRPLRGVQGALTLAVPSDEKVSFALAADQAKSVAAAVGTGAGTLDAYFEVRDEQGAVCSGNAAAEVFTISAAPVLFELRDGMDTLLARAETPLADAHRARIGGFSGTPSVSVGAVTVDGDADAGGLAKKLQNGIQDTVKACYAKFLDLDPGAGGAAVVGIETDKDGKVATVQFIANALADEALTKCLDDAIRAVKFSSGVRFRVPIELKVVTGKEK